MKTMDGCKAALIPLALALAWVPQAAWAQVQLTSEGHSAGTQCASTSVNDSGEVVGTCQSGNGEPVAFVAPNGVELPLSPLPGSLGCAAAGIANDGTVVGECRTATGAPAAVRWGNAAAGSAPVALIPLSLLGLLNQISTTASAYNQFGVVGGSSLDANGNGTAVVWMPGQSSPTQVSTGGDNCIVIDEIDQPGGAKPVVLLNCPDGSGRRAAKYAVPDGLLGAYVLHTMATAPNALNCYAAGINNAGKVIGTCEYAQLPYDRLATWTTPNGPAVASAVRTPDNLAIEHATFGAFINNAGNIVVHYRTSSGLITAAYIDSTTFAQLIIPTPSSGAPVIATAFSDNNRVLVESQDGNGRTQSGIFNPANPNVVTAEVFPGALNTYIAAISMSGGFVAGSVEDTSHTENAVAGRVP